MRQPEYLTPEAKRFWQRHSKRLQDAGILTEADYESFVLLAETWSQLRKFDAETKDGKERIFWIALSKQYFNLGRQFLLFPAHRASTGLEFNAGEKDEFGF